MRRVRAIVVGASAGALNALSTILSKLPKDYHLPVMIVVHIPPDKVSVLAEILQTKCAARVKEAEDKDDIEPGVVYVAPPDYHLLVEKNGQLSLSSEEPVLFSRPSIDVLFETAADAFGSDLLGIVLTGANNDGSAGLRAVVDYGGLSVVEDPADAYASAMPQAAIDICPEALIMSLDEISSFIQKAGTV